MPICSARFIAVAGSCGLHGHSTIGVREQQFTYVDVLKSGRRELHALRVVHAHNVVLVFFFPDRLSERALSEACVHRLESSASLHTHGSAKNAPVAGTKKATETDTDDTDPHRGIRPVSFVD